MPEDPGWTTGDEENEPGDQFSGPTCSCWADGMAGFNADPACPVHSQPPPLYIKDPSGKHVMVPNRTGPEMTHDPWWKVVLWLPVLIPMFVYGGAILVWKRLRG